MNLLFLDFTSPKLNEALSKLGYNIAAANKRGYKRLNVSNEFDIIYYAKFEPPLMDDLPPYLIRGKSKIIYGFHAPLFVHPAIRASSKIHNIISALKVPIFKLTKFYDAFHALNMDDYWAAKKLGLNSFYSPLGVDTSLFRAGSDKYDDFTVALTRARWGSGIDLAYLVIDKILKNQPSSDLKFVFIGDDSNPGFLTHYRAALIKKYPKNVSATGQIPQRQLAEIFHKSHLFLYTGRYESFGQVIIEALSCGMPVVGFNIMGAARDVLKDGVTGSTIKPFDINTMTDEVLKYYWMWKNNPKELGTISYNCRQYALNFDWNIIANNFDKMFRTTVSG